MSNEEASVVHLERVVLDVEDCGVVHLFDETYYEADEEPGGSNRSLGSFVTVNGSFVELSIALQWGEIPFTVAIADRDPGADLDDYEDVVETSFESPSGQLALTGWSIDWDEDAVRRLPPLPAGPGTYRLRYHARGMDEERYDVDDYYLQIWPAPPREAVVLKATSASCRTWLNPDA